MSRGKCFKEPLDLDDIKDSQKLAEIFTERLRQIIEETKGKVIYLTPRCLSGSNSALVNSVFRELMDALYECTNVVIDKYVTKGRVYNYTFSVERARKLKKEHVIMALDCHSTKKKDKPKEETKPKNALIPISVHIENEILRQIDELIKKGLYNTRAEFIRDAVRQHLAKFLCLGT